MSAGTAVLRAQPISWLLRGVSNPLSTNDGVQTQPVLDFLLFEDARSASS